MTEPRNTINVPVAGSNRFEQDVVMAISRLKASVMSPDGSPSFANLSLTDLDASKLSGTDADKSFQSINVGDSIALTGTTLDTIQDIRATATPTFAGLTLTGLSGVLQATAGVVSGSATLDDVPDGTSYERVAANQLSSGIYIDATTAVKGIASFDSDSFSVTSGAVSLVAGGGLNHNDLGGLQGGTTSEYYHLTETEHGYVSGANAQNVLTTASPEFAGLTLTGQGSVTSSSFPVWQVTRTSTVTDAIRTTLNCLHQTTADMVDGFGSSIALRVEDDESGELTLGEIAAIRSNGMDTNGTMILRTRNGVMRDYVYVLHNGSVGVGVSAPQERLHVDGKIRADTAFNLNGTDGITVTDTVVTALRDNAGQLQYKSKTLTFVGGIRTATGAESDWTDVPSA